MINSTLQREFFTPGYNLFVILDGTAAPELFSKIHSDAPEHVCLYRELPPEFDETTPPYLVRLEHGNRFTQWLLSQGWGKNWGIFARIRDEIDLKQVRKHFRSFLMVEYPDGKSEYFRYYDPRVMRDYLPTCDAAETSVIFGPVTAYFVEGAQENIALRYTVKRGLPYGETVRLD